MRLMDGSFATQQEHNQLFDNSKFNYANKQLQFETQLRQNWSPQMPGQPAMIIVEDSQIS